MFILVSTNKCKHGKTEMRFEEFIVFKKLRVKNTDRVNDNITQDEDETQLACFFSKNHENSK